MRLDAKRRSAGLLPDDTCCDPSGRLVVTHDYYPALISVVGKDYIKIEPHHAKGHCGTKAIADHVSITVTLYVKALINRQYNKIYI
jgi:hypothetical protein